MNAKSEPYSPLSFSLVFSAMGLSMTLSTSAMAVDFGPFTLTGFAKAEV